MQNSRHPYKRFSRGRSRGNRPQFSAGEDSDQEIPQGEEERSELVAPNGSGRVIDLSEVRSRSLKAIEEFAFECGVEDAGILLKNSLLFAIMKKACERGDTLLTSGVVEMTKDGSGFLRAVDQSYAPEPDDAFLPSNTIRKFGIRPGDVVVGIVRAPKHNERNFVINQVTSVNGQEPSAMMRRINFDNLTPLYPDSKIKLEMEGAKDLSSRIIDLVCPLGKGQRALIVAPPRSGKTMLMQNIAQSIVANHPEVELMVLLIDERPEEVTDMKRSVRGEVVSSTFDEPASRHVQLAELLIERAKRRVELKKDVVILLDNITRLARAYNAVAPSSGKVLSGGVDSNALQKPKRFFGAARNIEGGGSLTIIATSLVETGSRMDEVIFEEFKGTGNAEIVLDRKIADKRVFPAIDITKSGTRKEDLLYDKATMSKLWVLRRILMPMGGVDGMEFLVDKLRATKNNASFFESMTMQRMED